MINEGNPDGLLSFWEILCGFVKCVLILGSFRK